MTLNLQIIAPVSIFSYNFEFLIDFCLLFINKMIILLLTVVRLMELKSLNKIVELKFMNRI